MVLPTSLSSLRMKLPRPERSAHWWTRPEWRRVYPWSPCVQTPDRSGENILLKCILNKMLMWCKQNGCSTFSSLSSSSSSHSNMASMDCCGNESRTRVKVWAATGGNITLAFVFTHHVGCVPAWAKEEVPDQKQQQTQRQHVQFKVPHHHHKELKKFDDEDLHLEIIALSYKSVRIRGRSIVCRSVTTSQWQGPTQIAAHVFVSYHKGNDAPLCWLPLKAAVDVGAIADQDHDASLHPVKILLKQLETWTDRQL